MSYREPFEANNEILVIVNVECFRGDILHRAILVVDVHRKAEIDRRQQSPQVQCK